MMKSKLFMSVACAVVVLVVSGTLLAHHGTPAYDSKITELKPSPRNKIRGGFAPPPFFVSEGKGPNTRGCRNRRASSAAADWLEQDFHGARRCNHRLHLRVQER